MRRPMLGMLCTVAGLTLAALAAAPGTARAQNAVIRGTVRSDNGEAVTGANVYILELSVQAASNEQGRYVLTVPGDRVRGQALQLRVRAIGYRPGSKPITVTVGDQSADFSLAADINRLDEIVVTGVMEGTEKARLPFAVTTVDVADLPVPGFDPIRMLAGRVPGANVVSASGRPGSAPAILLRGVQSINGQGRGQGPLYILDGIMVNGALPDINPSDIENIEVVKGAAASSLYGSRAGSGVIQITTRSGRRSADGMSFNVRGETGGSDIERSFGLSPTTAVLMDAQNQRLCISTAGQPLCAQTIDWNAEAARVNNIPGDFAGAPQTLPLDPGASTNAVAIRNSYQAKLWPGRIFDPVRQLTTTQPVSTGTFDMTGRFNNTTVYASASALDQAGAIRFLNGFQRYTGRVNVDQRIGSDWTASLRTYYGRSYQDGFNQETGNNDAFFRLTRQRTIENLLQLDTLGRIYIRSDIQGAGAQNQNPLQGLQNTTDVGLTDRFLGGLTLRFTPAHWVDMEGNFSYDLQNFQRRQFSDKGFRTTASSPTTNNGFIYEENDRNQSFNTSFSATFRAQLTSNITSRYSLRALYEQQDFDFRSGQGNTLAAIGVPQLNNATSGLGISSQFTTVRQIGVFAGAALDMWNGRYGIDGLIRRDGSSLFGSANRWQTYGRLSAYWNIATEPWWFAPRTITAFKLRASRGSAGGRPQFFAQYETWNASVSGISFGALGNENLRPEVTVDNEVGADIELWHRALITITHDASETRDQILQVPTPAEKGFGSSWQNAGTLSNKTWELSLNLPVVQRRNLTWTWTFTYDRTRTMVDSLAVPPFNFGGFSQAVNTIFLAKQGEAFGTLYGRKFMRSCDDLPAAFRSDCGGTNTGYQINDDGFVVWTGGTAANGITWRDGITKNLYGTQLPNASAPYGVAENFGMPIIIRDSTCVSNPSCAALQLPIGSGLPAWQFSIGQDLQWHRLSVYALLQGVMGRYVYNQGRGWAHLDYMSNDISQRGRSVETAKPIGYYWRAAAPDNVGIGGLYDILGPNNYAVESTSYAKLRELRVSYNVGPVSGVGNWNVSVIGRNLFTITNYTGFDPEVGQGGGLASSSAINAVDAFAFPNTRSFTFALSTSF